MTILRHGLHLISLLALIASFGASAGVYKCVDRDGSISYAQTPCPNQVTTSISTSSNDRSNDPSNDPSSNSMDCDVAQGFALTVARSMKRGNGSADVFDQYGGIAGLSKNAVNVINYVYVFQHSVDVSADRIAALANNKCDARAFGDISCEAMPIAYVDQIGGCDNEQTDTEKAGSAVSEDASAPRTTAFEPAIDERANAGARAQRIREREAQTRADEAREDCRSRSQSEIDGVNASMRGGYSSAQGEQYRRRLRSLRDEKNAC